MGNSASRTSTTSSSPGSASSFWSHVVTRNNSRLSFDLAIYIQERDELAADLRLLARDARVHRQAVGTWQVAQGTASVTAGVATGVALLAATAGGAAVLPMAAAVVTKSVTAAGLASSAALFTHTHKVDQDFARRLHNLQHIVHSLAQKDDEINLYFKVVHGEKIDRKNLDHSTTTVDKKDNVNDKNGACKENTPNEKTNKSSDSSKSKDTARASNSQRAIRACHALCQIWEEHHLDQVPDDDKIPVIDLAVALAQSSSVILGAHSIVQGHKQTQQPHGLLETALQQMADALDYETRHIQKLDVRYLRCLPALQPSSRHGGAARGRLLHVDGGSGQVTMKVTFDDPSLKAIVPTSKMTTATDKTKSSAEETTTNNTTTLRSDSTRSIRLPYGATNIKVTFRDLAGKPVHKVDRSHPKQPWVKNDKGKSVLEECHLDHADGVDVVFVVKGSLTHAYIHKAWDFGRPAGVPPRAWEWWGDANGSDDDDRDDVDKPLQQFKDAPLEVQQRLAMRETAKPMHTTSCGTALCCLAPEELMPFPIAM